MSAVRPWLHVVLAGLVLLGSGPLHDALHGGDDSDGHAAASGSLELHDANCEHRGDGIAADHECLVCASRAGLAVPDLAAVVSRAEPAPRRAPTGAPPRPGRVGRAGPLGARAPPVGG